MTLAAGTRLGPYEILAPIGAGGMGEVYRARDTRLERMVAIKVLPQGLTPSPEARQRFEREAKTISQLSHPHICALYDVGREGDTEYLVMEYLEGETLSVRLGRGPLPAEQVLKHGIDMADALDKAHRQGIVHRDLKPGNVMLTKSGVKLLDFGLAKATAPSSSEAGLSSVPTADKSLTTEGSLVGTLPYMAPEQLEGREADARTDIFAFGAMLYELATGRKAFAGANRAALITAIMSSEPAPIATIRPLTPPALDRLVASCLDKDPENRVQTAHDVMLQLRWIAESGSQSSLPASVAAKPGGRQRWARAGLVLSTLAAAAFAVGYFRRAPGPSRVIRFEIVPGPNAPYTEAGKDRDPAPALSPDGNLLAFVAEDSGGRTLLWLRSLRSLEARPLAGTENANHPFWSPDSRFIGFFAEGKLRRVEASGGPVQNICDAEKGRGGTWNRDGVVLFAASATSPILRVAASGGPPTEVTRLDSAHQENSHRWPSFLPDGKHFLYFSWLGANPDARSQNGGTRVASLDSMETKLVVAESSNAVYGPPGYLVFYREGNLLAQPFDLAGLRTTGDPVPIAQNLAYIDPRKFASFSTSQAGLLAYASARPVRSRLRWVDRSGRETVAIGEPGSYRSPRLSPDGRRILVSLQDPHTMRNSLWIGDLSRGSMTRFTSGPGSDTDPVWSPDQGQVIFGAMTAGAPRLYRKTIDGVDGEALLKTTGVELPTDWSRDGRFILYEAAGIWVLPLAGDRKPFPFVQSKARVGSAVFSPDGRWIAYVSDESGRQEVFVAPFPGPGGKVQVSTSGGSQPRWRGDGRELYYISDDKKLTAAEVKPGSTFEVGTIQSLFEARMPPSLRWSYDATSDGRRFLVNAMIGGETAPPITVVTNWAAELRK